MSHEPSTPQYVAAEQLKFWAHHFVEQMMDSEVPEFYEMSEEHMQALAVEMAARVACVLRLGCHGQG